MTTDGSRITTGYDIIHHIVVVYLYTALLIGLRSRVGYRHQTVCIHGMDMLFFFLNKCNIKSNI